MKNFKRIIATIITVATLTVMASFVTVSANASASTPKGTSVSATMVTMMQNDTMAISLPMIKADNAATDAYNADSAFSNIVSFFAKWMARVGGLVAFVGAIMFALAIKNNDAEQKQAGLLTLVAGFAAIAITAATSWFGF